MGLGIQHAPGKDMKMKEKGAVRADCYSDGDRRIMVITQKIRAKLFWPLLDLLQKMGVTANTLTFLSLLAGLAFCPLFFYSKLFALAMLALHIFLDGLDGPLARHTGKASRKGSFTDTMSDQIVIAGTTVTLVYAGVVSPLPGGIYIFVYTVVIAFSMIRNALSIPYSWLVRPRFVIYSWFVVELYYLPRSIDTVLWLFIALLACKMISGFVKIRKKI